MRKILLASKSPRRKQLLEWAEIPFEILVRETDESYPEYLSTEEIPVHIAKQKALAAQRYINSSSCTEPVPILSADTIVVVGSEIIGKPRDEAEAIQILQKLSGITHRVMTGVVILWQGEEHSFCDITEVSFHTLSEDQIRYYVQRYQPFDKAGAYAIQEWIGVTGIRSIRGDFYNVMGLPVSRVVKILAEIR